MPHKVAVTLLAGFALIAAPVFAQARSSRPVYIEPGPFPQIGVPFSSRDIGIPGPERICVKGCTRDSSPCDPIEYKQADGRCNYDW